MSPMGRGGDCCVLVLILTNVINGFKTEPGSYDYSDYTDYSNNAYEDDTKEEESIRIPEFISHSKNLLVNEGSTIRLPCLVDNLDPRINMIWKKGSKVLALGDNPYDKSDDRIKVEKRKTGNQLVIRMVDFEDAGEYICQVAATEIIELRHSVNIILAPAVQAVPSGVVRVKEGSSATLSCQVTRGTPEPVITWKRRERPMSTGEYTIEGESLTFPSTTRHHSGIYICRADNGGAHPATDQVRLDVQHAPIVEQDQLFVHDRDGDELDITCTVHASPQAKVEWFRDSILLSDTERVIRIVRMGNKHSLLLPSLGDEEQDRGGTYSCRATNSLGQAMAEVNVAKHPPLLPPLPTLPTPHQNPPTEAVVMHTEEEGYQTVVADVEISSHSIITPTEGANIEEEDDKHIYEDKVIVSTEVVPTVEDREEIKEKEETPSEETVVVTNIQEIVEESNSIEGIAEVKVDKDIGDAVQTHDRDTKVDTIIKDDATSSKKEINSAEGLIQEKSSGIILYGGTIFLGLTIIVCNMSI